MKKLTKSKFYFYFMKIYIMIYVIQENGYFSAILGCIKVLANGYYWDVWYDIFHTTFTQQYTISKSEIGQVIFSVTHGSVKFLLQSSHVCCLLTLWNIVLTLSTCYTITLWAKPHRITYLEQKKWKTQNYKNTLIRDLMLHITVMSNQEKLFKYVGISPTVAKPSTYVMQYIIIKEYEIV